jgi:hypothetical protein
MAATMPSKGTFKSGGVGGNRQRINPKPNAKEASVSQNKRWATKAKAMTPAMRANTKATKAIVFPSGNPASIRAPATNAPLSTAAERRTNQSMTRSLCRKR